MKTINTKLPDFSHEKNLWEKGYLVIGVDEVGRGCLAGPLMVGAVCFPSFINDKSIVQNSETGNDIYCESSIPVDLSNIGINDSKLLSKMKREYLAKIITKNALFCATGQVSVGIINKKGIVAATEIAMRKAIKSIMQKVETGKQQQISSKQKIASSLQEEKNMHSTNYLLHSTNYYLLADAFRIKYLRGIGLKNQEAIIHGDRISISIAAASIIAKVARDALMEKLSLKYPIYLWHKNKGYGTREHIEALKKHGKTPLHRDLFIRNIVLSPLSESIE